MANTCHAELLRLVESAGYQCMELDEVCGVPKDSRSLMCIPVELHVPACEHSRYVSGHHGHGRGHGRVPTVNACACGERKGVLARQQPRQRR